jgi:hypothetical protein
VNVLGIHLFHLMQRIALCLQCTHACTSPRVLWNSTWSRYKESFFNLRNIIRTCSAQGVIYSHMFDTFFVRMLKRRRRRFHGRPRWSRLGPTSHAQACMLCNTRTKCKYRKAWPTRWFLFDHACSMLAVAKYNAADVAI